METSWPKLKMETGCQGSHESVDKAHLSPSHSQNLPFCKNRNCFSIILIIPQIAGDKAYLMVHGYVDGLTGCRMRVFCSYSLATTVQRAGARLSTSTEFLMFYSLLIITMWPMNLLMATFTIDKGSSVPVWVTAENVHLMLTGKGKSFSTIWVWPLFSTSDLVFLHSEAREQRMTTESWESHHHKTSCNMFPHAKSQKEWGICSGGYSL